MSDLSTEAARDAVDLERSDPSVPRPPMPEVLPEPSERGERFVAWLRGLDRDALLREAGRL